MVEPTTVNKALIVPNDGDLSGTWGSAALNPDFVALDGMMGGVGTISLTAATTFALTVPTGTITPSAGPNQSQNALIRLTGALLGTCTLQFSLPGFYIIENKCTVGAYCVTLAPSSGTGNVIGAPPGRKCHVFFDGFDMDYVDMPEVGSALDLHGFTALPAWMAACTIQPYLIKNGTTLNISSFTALGQQLGSTFGGNGITTFGLPDEMSRVRLPLDLSGTNRITVAGSGINGAALNSAGGSQFMQQHNHTATDPGHTHGVPGSAGLPTVTGPGASGSGPNFVAQFGGALSTAVTGITINNSGLGTTGSQNMMPSIVSFLPLIKT